MSIRIAPLLRLALAVSLVAAGACSDDATTADGGPSIDGSGGSDAQLDAPAGDAGAQDGGMDGAADAGTDAPADAGVDAPADAGVDAPFDGGTDAGDAGASLGGLERISESMDGGPSDHNAGRPVLSPSARYVAFESVASDLVAGDDNGWSDLFLLDRTSSAIERVVEGTDLTTSIGRYDVSEGGALVTFDASDGPYVAGDDNGHRDVFVWQRADGAIERLALGSGGGQPDGAIEDPSISADGRYVALEIWAPNRAPTGNPDGINVGVYDRTDEVLRVVEGPGMPAYMELTGPTIARDGSVVVFSCYGDLLDEGLTEGRYVYIYDVSADSVTERIPRAGGTAGGTHISPDGRYVAFVAADSDDDPYELTDIYFYDRDTGDLERIDVTADGTYPNAASYEPYVSDDGRYVTFRSMATTLGPADADYSGIELDGSGAVVSGFNWLFVKDRTTGQLTRLDRAYDGSYGETSVSSAHVAGTTVAFATSSPLLADEEPADASQAYVRGLAGVF